MLLRPTSTFGYNASISSEYAVENVTLKSKVVVHHSLEVSQVLIVDLFFVVTVRGVERAVRQGQRAWQQFRHDGVVNNQGGQRFPFLIQSLGDVTQLKFRITMPPKRTDVT